MLEASSFDGTNLSVARIAVSAIRWMPINLGEFTTSLAFSCARVNFLSDRPAAPTGLRNPGVPADFPTGALSSKAAQSLATREQKSATRRYGTLGHHLANLAPLFET